MRRSYLFALSAALGGACTRLNPAFDNETGETGAAGEASTAADPTGTATPTTSEAASTSLSSGTGTSSTATTEAITGGEVTTDVGDTSTGSTGSTSGTTADTSTTADNGDGEPPATCFDALQRGEVESGVQTLAVPEQPGATIEVWCEQGIAGGGWLLVGRSASGQAPAFGWGSGTGDLSDDSKAYSLNLLAYKYLANEMLLGDYITGKQLNKYAYHLDTPDPFPLAFDDMAGMTGYAGKILGDCDPGDGPSRLRWIGYTKLGDRFRMRDKPEAGDGDKYGLFSNGFYLGDDDCSNGGELNNKQGLIFVR